MPGNGSRPPSTEPFDCQETDSGRPALLVLGQAPSRLYERAMGYQTEDIDVRVINGEIIQTPIVKNYPPDTTAAIFWLKNRNPHEWRDKKTVEVGMTSLADALRQLDREEKPMLPMDSHYNVTD